MYYQWKKRVKIYIEILDNISVHYEYVAENITRKESARWIIFFFINYYYLGQEIQKTDLYQIELPLNQLLVICGCEVSRPCKDGGVTM